MPLVRRWMIPKVELAGRTKYSLDVLLWVEQLDDSSVLSLDELECLRIYFHSVSPLACQIRLLVPKRHANTASVLDRLEISYQSVDERDAEADVASQIEGADPELLTAVGTLRGPDHRGCQYLSRISVQENRPSW